MGGSSWSNDFYAEREATRKVTGTPTFAYDHAINTGKASREVHARLNPKGVKIREARDSAAHPESLPIAVLLDVTGSMQTVPVNLQKNLCKLMGMLTSKGYVEHPQILFGAIGDARSDQGSIQIGQFESGIEMDEDLGHMWLEGGGGGSNEESYQNALYFFARHTATDAFEKRNKKGYLFIVGDELPYSKISRTEVQALFGDFLEADIPTSQIVKEAQEKYHVFFLFPANTHNGHNASNRKAWEDLLGMDHVLPIADENAICEAVALTVGLTEGKTTLEAGRENLVANGATATAVNSVVAAMDRVVKTTPMGVSTSRTARL